MKKSIWCEGCGLGNMSSIITSALVSTVSKRLEVDPNTREGLERIKNNIAFVSGIGCTSRMPGQLDFNTLHTAHGRSLAFATGIKLARPELTVALAAGDGDIFAIGGNHFIHTARRNIDMTLIVYNNKSYGMTGAQHSPTSPLGEIGTSAPYGVFEPPFNVVNLALGAGATFVAQGALTTSQEHLDQAEALIVAALGHKGFSLVNLIGTCHTGWGARNRRAEAFRYRRYLEEKVMKLESWKALPPDEQGKYFPLGIIHQDDSRPDFQSSKPYLDAIERAKKAVAGTQELLEDITLVEQDPLAVYPRTSVRFAGSGGQGVLTAGETDLYAAFLSGKSGVFIKNYGPEARGGGAYSQVTISDGEIHFPQAENLEVLVALTQEAYDKYRGEVSAQGKIIVNSTAVKEFYGDARVIASPIGDLLAREVRPPKKEQGINVLALALTMGLFNLAPRGSVETAVKKYFSDKNLKMNLRALDVGYKEAERQRGLI